MAVFYDSRYEFTLENQNYIQAIAKFNKNVSIEKINGQKVQLCGSELPQYLTQHFPSNSNFFFSIECHSSNANSTAGLFPTPSSQDLPLKAAITPLAKQTKGLIFDHISLVLSMAEKGYDLGVVPPSLSKLDQIDALGAMSELKDKVSDLGIMHLSSLNAIILQTKSENFCLVYGENTRFFNMHAIAFDIDDGFVSKLENLFGSIEEQ